MTKAQGRWQHAAQRASSSIQRAVRKMLLKQKLRAHVRTVGRLRAMMATHMEGFDGEVDKTWTAEEAAEEALLKSEELLEQHLVDFPDE